MFSNDWREHLLRRYPDLFGPTRTGNAEETRGYPTVGDGWREIVEKAMERVAAAIAIVSASDAQVTFRQIGEKLGALRIDCTATGLPDDTVARIGEAIALAEARADCTCESCGAPGRLYDNDGWYATMCEVHAQGEPARVRPGYESLHIERDIVDGKLTVTRCRRYDRGRDCFVDAALPPDWEDE